MRRRPYIANGQVVRDSSGRSFRGTVRYTSRGISWKRVCLVLLTAGIFMATNPANYLPNGPFAGLGQYQRQLSNSNNFSSQVANRVTNYLLFSVEEKFESIIFSALQMSLPCHYNDPKIGELCDIIGKLSLLILKRERNMSESSSNPRSSSHLPF